jgi:hypothetical protein
MIFLNQFPVLLLQVTLGLAGLRRKVAVAQTLSSSFSSRSISGLRNRLRFCGRFSPSRRVGGNKLGFQIGQRAHTQVMRLSPCVLLIADQRDEEAQLGDLDGDGLYVSTVDAVLNQVELATIVQRVIGKVAIDRLDREARASGSSISSALATGAAAIFHCAGPACPK